MESYTIGVADFKINPSKINAILAKMGPKMSTQEWEFGIVLLKKLILVTTTGIFMNR